jgi:hypothetical protein
MAVAQTFPIRYGLFRPLLSVLGMPVKLKTLQVSVDSPEELIAALTR